MASLLGCGWVKFWPETILLAQGLRAGAEWQAQTWALQSGVQALPPVHCPEKDMMTRWPRLCNVQCLT